MKIQQQSKFHDSTLNQSTETETDKLFEDSVKRVYSAWTRNLVYQTLYSDYTSVGWHCYECMKSINVSIYPILNNQNFNSTSLFCTEHKPTNYKILDTAMFVRYESTFFKAIKQLIIDNSMPVN